MKKYFDFLEKNFEKNLEEKIITTLFVDVLLPLHLPGTYTYRVPSEYNNVIGVGQRVVVQFGAKRLYSALVRRIHDQVPEYRTKYILSILDII